MGNSIDEINEQEYNVEFSEELIDFYRRLRYAAEGDGSNALTGEVMEAITEIINDWDPIGFFPMAPKDEYFNEIKKICEFICAKPNVQIEPLARAINKIFAETFGPDVYDEDMEQCIVIAKKIRMVEKSKKSIK